MNLKSTRKLTALCLSGMLWIAFPSVVSADDDFGWIQSIEATKEFGKRFDLSVDGEMRTYDCGKEIDRFNVGISASYKLFDFLKINGGYSFLYSYKPEEIKLKDIDNGFQEYNIEDAFKTNRHRLQVSLTGNVKWGRFVFSLRERLQYTYQEETSTMQTKYRYSESFGGLVQREPEEEIVRAKNKTMLRSRAMVKWDIKKCKFEPYASYELTHWINNGGMIDKSRLVLGTEYKVSKKSSFDLYYMYQRQNDDDEADGHFVGLGYSIEF